MDLDDTSVTENVEEPVSSGIEETAETVESTEEVAPDVGEPEAASANDPVAEFERLLAEESGAAPAAVPEDLKPPEGVDPTSRSGNRWQALVGRTKTAESRAAELESQRDQAVQYVQQVQGNAQQQVAQANAQVAELRGQLTAMQSQMQAFMSGKLVPKTAPDDPAARLQERWMSEADKLFNERLQAATTPLQEEIQKMKEASKLAERQKVSQQYQSGALQAAREVVLRGFAPELAGELEHPLSGQILATAMFMEQPDMAKAAQIVRNTYLKFGLGILRAKAQARTSNQAKTKDVSTPIARQRSNGRGSGVPTDDDIDKAGGDALALMLQRDGY